MTNAARRWLVFAAAAAGVLAAAAAVPRPGTLHDIPYADAADGVRTLDLYLPATSDAPPPLVAFVHSQLWARADEKRDLATRFARPLQSEGAAVAMIRHRLAPDHPHPEQARDVALAVDFLFENAGRFGYDPTRIYLAGHSSGAHLAALVALDPSYLAVHGRDPKQLAGVVAISGVYDLNSDRERSREEDDLIDQAFGRRDRKDASPIRHVRPDAPRFLILAAEDDIPGYVDEAREFAAALRRAGHPDAEDFFSSGRDHLSILDLSDVRNSARIHVLAFLGLAPLPTEMAELIEGVRYWRNPRFDSASFRKPGVRVRRYDADPRFVQAVRGIFRSLTPRAQSWTAKRYEAVDLFDWIDEDASGGQGPFLTVETLRGEQFTWRVDEIRPYRPVIVVAIDDEPNLFRITDPYRPRKQYSWRDEPDPPFMVRPLGAFLYFQKPPPPASSGRRFVHGFVPDGVHRSARDPRESFDDLPPDVRDVLAGRDGCAGCHAFRGSRARAGHLRARDGVVDGGFALPLTEYPDAVLRRFVFDPGAIIEEIGAHPSGVDDPALANALYERIVAERSAPAGP